MRITQTGNEVQDLLLLVDRFAVEMKAKLVKKYVDGYRGWNNPAELYFLRDKLEGSVSMGDRVDTANFSAMLWNLEDGT